MDISISQAQDSDYPEIFHLVETAFLPVIESDHREHLLVERLRHSDSFVPQLSLVAKDHGGNISGFILLTEIEIVSEDGTTYKTLAVAPVAVLPEYQNQGIGGALLDHAHKTASSLGYNSAILLGHKDYYPNFGYRKASDFKIRFPFDAPDDCCMAIELQPDALRHVQGIVRYPDTFFE